MKSKGNSQFSTLNSPSIPRGYKQTEVGVIPEDWEAFGLETSARIVDSLHQTPHFSDDGYPMVRVTDIKTGDLDLSETFVEGGAVLLNQYSVIAVNPGRCPRAKYDLAREFIGWITAPDTQKRIGDFKRLGKPLFTPNAVK